MIRVQIDKNNAWVTQREKITMYSENYDAVQIELSLSDDWNGLSKIAVFRAGDTQLDIAVTSDTVTIPVNAILHPNVHLYFGLYGLATANGRVAIPTTWADLGIIQPAADPTAASNYNQPVPDLYAQIVAKTEAAEAAALAATTGTYASSATFSLGTTGEVVGHLLMTVDDSDPTDLGLVSSYGEAVAAGYEGTEAEFRALLIANYGSATTIAGLQDDVEELQSDFEDLEDEMETVAAKADAAKDSADAATTAVSGKQAKYKTATLTLASGASSWADQAATGVTATNLVFWDVDPDDYAVAAAAQIHMTAQGAGVVSFESVNATTAAVKINLAIFD